MAATVDTTGKERTMHDLQASPIVLTEIIDGPVELTERIYAFDELRKLCNSSPEPVVRADARLFSEPTTYPGPAAIAECRAVVNGDTIVVVGAVGNTMRQAIDQLIGRLRQRLIDRTSREQCEARTTPGLRNSLDLSGLLLNPSFGEKLRDLLPPRQSGGL